MPVTTAWPANLSTDTTNPPLLSSLVTSPSPVVSGPTAATFTLTGSNFGSLLSGIRVVFHKGADTDPVQDAVSLGLGGPGVVTGLSRAR